MKILVLNASTTGITKSLFERAKPDFAKKFGKAEFTEFDLSTLETSLTSKNIKSTFYSEGTKYIDMMQKYDEVILVVGMHNFGMPATVKNFIDRITLAKVTFEYTANGLTSPMRGKWKPKFIVFASSGASKDFYSAKSPREWINNFFEIMEFNGFNKSQLAYVWADGTNLPTTIKLSEEKRYEFFKEKLTNLISY